MAGIDITHNFLVIPIPFDVEGVLIDGRGAPSFSNVHTSNAKLPNIRNCRWTTVRLSAPQRRRMRHPPQHPCECQERGDERQTERVDATVGRSLPRL